MFKINILGIEELQKAMQEYAGNVEETITDVLHNDGAVLIQDSIRRIIPESGITWQGKRAAAKGAKSLRSDNNENLSVTVRTTKNYQYLYFPDDGSNTKNHFGNQQFFARGAEAVTNEIVNRCIARLTEDFK